MVLSGVQRKKSPVTPPGIDPGTSRPVAQRLNHHATPGPLHVKYPLYLSCFNKTNFIDRFLEKYPKYENFMKIRPVGAELFHMGRWRDRQNDEDNSRFSQFCEKRKIERNGNRIYTKCSPTLLANHI